MDCPHCGEENLLGAVSCMACGKSLFEAPEGFGSAAAPAAGPRPARDPPPRYADPPPGPAQKSASEGLPRCRVCLEPFERSLRGPQSDTCSSCRHIVAQGGDQGQNDIQFAPQPEMHSEYTQRLGSKDLRPPREMHLKVGIRKGPVAILVGLLLVIVGTAVVYLKPKSDHFSMYVVETAPKETDFTVAPQPDRLTRFQTDMNLRLLHESMKASFVNDLVPKLDIHQTSRHKQELLFHRAAPNGVVVDLHTENLVLDQEGFDGSRDAREVDCYPWRGKISTHKALLSIEAPASTETGTRLEPGSDVTPLLTLAAVGAPNEVVTAGKRWLASVRLPLLCDANGRLFQADFPCHVEYIGRKLNAGYDCIVIRFSGRPPSTPPERLSSMNRTGGQLEGVVFYDAETGLVVEAHVDVDVNCTRDRGRLEDRVRVVGQLTISRE